VLPRPLRTAVGGRERQLVLTFTRFRCASTQRPADGLGVNRKASRCNNYVCRNSVTYSPRNANLSSVFGDPQTITNSSRLVRGLHVVAPKRPGSRCHEAPKGESHETVDDDTRCGAVAAASPNQADAQVLDIVYACVNNGSGTIKIVSVVETCANNEIPLSWNEVGVEGPVGPIGPQGLQGFPGPMGLPGMKGPIGPVGPQGTQGPIGPQGNTGATGPQGNTGAQGPAGATGATGATGAMGLPGAQGPKGDRGPAGPPGVGGDGAAAMQYWGIATEGAAFGITCSAGVYRYTSLCQANFGPDARWCTSEEILKTINWPPLVEGSGWVRPTFVPSNTGEAVDMSGVSALSAADLTCDGWALNSPATSGLAFGLVGAGLRFRKVAGGGGGQFAACCGPPLP
jgi:hypothetical protein